ncbi:hypothetical protein CERZMDRAFT_87264 [Cercospora zeae-maydis SCOH1-5]|uniref:Uncharacterized protein n=1 Tax=Cercospora zeae-maydis SCOH1-5 TaxID=717836 RepID=A0A6A6F6X3_9PEZI|nr:hypothetical protein CERZMDRAFT_87264 [Cercospora zeae-maydis SCOH1-5]
MSMSLDEWIRHDQRKLEKKPKEGKSKGTIAKKRNAEFVEEDSNADKGEMKRSTSLQRTGGEPSPRAKAKGIVEAGDKDPKPMRFNSKKAISSRPLERNKSLQINCQSKKETAKKQLPTAHDKVDLAQKREPPRKRKRIPSPPSTKSPSASSPPPPPPPPASRTNVDQDDDEELAIKKEPEYKVHSTTTFVRDKKRVEKHQVDQRNHCRPKFSKALRDRMIQKLQMELKQVDIEKKLLEVRKLEVQREIIALKQK